MSDDDITALSAALYDARRARIAFEDERDAAMRLLQAEVNDKIREAYGAREAEVKKRETDAREALREGEERRGLAGNADMYQGILMEWIFTGYGSHGRYMMTGRKGRYEIRKRETVFPGNRQYGLPPIEARFIRLLKKDGSPALGFVSGYRVDENWLPEGEKPKGAAA